MTTETITGYEELLDRCADAPFMGIAELPDDVAKALQKAYYQGFVDGKRDIGNDSLKGWRAFKDGFRIDGDWPFGAKEG